MLPPKSDLHAAARKLVSNGFPVFPCWPETKVPYTQNGFKDATLDLEVIDAWWSAEPRLNIAFSPHQVGLAVIDLDGDEGEASWDHWQIEHGYLPLTYTVQTPRGGRHLYYRGILPPTQSKLGPHVDTRGVGSYVLAPPSRVVDEARGIDGDYHVVDGRAPADLGDEVAEYLRSLAKEKVKAAVSELDLPQNVSRAAAHLRQLVASGRVAIEDQNGDKTTYVVACDVMNLGCSPEKTLELMLEIFNPACLPPWDEDELEIKVKNAASYAQNEAGAWAVGSSEETFASALDKLPRELLEEPTEPEATKVGGHPWHKLWTLGEMRALPPPDWLLPDLLPALGVSILFGLPGTLKTYIAIEWSCTLASLGIPVLYVAAEGSTGVAQRIDAWCLVHDIDPDTLPLALMRAAPLAKEGAMIQEFIDKSVKPFKPVLVVIDTLARTATGLDENSSKDMGQIVNMLDGIRNQCQCAVLIIHHSGKDGERGPRGSGALTGGVDAAFEASRPNRDVPMVKVKCTRQKDTQEREAPWLYEGRKIGAQIVLQETSLSEFHDATSTLPTITGTDVGKALRALKAIGEENGVSTNVLADKLAETLGKTPEEKDALKTGCATIIGRGAGGLRKAYSTGNPPMWWLPPEETPPE